MQIAKNNTARRSGGWLARLAGLAAGLALVIAACQVTPPVTPSITMTLNPN